MRSDHALRTAAAVALLLVLLLACWSAALAAADDAWVALLYPGARVITVASRFTIGISMIVLGVLLVARPAARQLGMLLVTVSTIWFLPTLTADLLAIGGRNPFEAAATMGVSAVGFACRAPTVLLLPMRLIPLRACPLRWIRAALTVWVIGYYAGHGALWLLASAETEPAMDRPVGNPLFDTALSPSAVDHVNAYLNAETGVLAAASAAGTFVLALAAARTPGSGRRILLLVAVLYPLGAHLLLAERWNSNVRAVAALSAGSALWATAISIGIAGTGAWRLDRSARHRVAQACVVMVLTAAVILVATAAWAVFPALRTSGTFTAAVGALCLGRVLPPAARRATGWVERLFYGPRAGAHEAARTLATRLQQAPHPGDVPEQICRSAVEDIGVAGAAVTVDLRSGPRQLAVAGRPPDGTGTVQVFPLRHHGRIVGRLQVTRDGASTPAERDSGLLTLLTDQAGPALAALQLTEEAQAARERLVLTREEERRRLRREIHDGLGPLLASVRLRIDLAQARRPTGDTGADELQLALDGLGEALVEVRRITAGLTPAALVERGLADALRDLAHRLAHPGLDIRLDAPAHRLAGLAPAVETAAYRITAEALTNAVRHAAARRIHITLAATEAGALTVTVTDDGTSPAAGAPAGTGLASMAERAEEIGGSCTVTSTPTGTTVSARLPAPPGTPEERDDHT
ncbi:histidine kinase [Streptomyces sp. NBC_00414]|uniref:ATP-binding protein n=1 Tax=Streptomyces sp. NBC_00414 TaxID=2975739 RepID=UPI002E1FEF65